MTRPPAVWGGPMAVTDTRLEHVALHPLFPLLLEFAPLWDWCAEECREYTPTVGVADDTC